MPTATEHHPESLAAKQARIDAVRWYHEFDFGNGLHARSTTPDVEVHRAMWRFIQQQLDQVDFRGKTVLDVGCWDGHWSFYAERRGARSVLAADDLTQNWSDGRGLHLARELYGSNIEINQHLSVFDLASLGRKFDIILLLGVYYHLLDPYYAFAQVRHCCHADSLVLIEGNEGLALPAKAALFDLGNRTSKFVPTLGALEEMLRAAYFTVASTQSMESPAGARERPGWGWRMRMCAQALLGSRGGVADLMQPVLAMRRTFLTCVPMTGRNDAHVYRPPFGLHMYDDRFGDGSR
jgi:tRNA (mo5U34)-methyltransferase